MTGPVIHIVDDDEPLRIGLVRLLRANGYEVRAYSSAGDFLLTPAPEGPGCLVLDVRMPGPSGLELQEALKRYAVALPIVFLTGHGDVISSVRAMKAGAVDFLIKPVEPEVLLRAVETALMHDSSQRAARAGLVMARTRWATLTEREREVFERVVTGALNKQIAAEFGITERTVKAHRAQVMAKMGARSFAELVQTAELLRASGVASPPAAPTA
jgi:FixJ family two-component response regulator